MIIATTRIRIHFRGRRICYQIPLTSVGVQLITGRASSMDEQWSSHRCFPNALTDMEGVFWEVLPKEQDPLKPCKPSQP